MLRYFITASPANMNSNYDVSIKYLYNGVVHPDTGKTITQYKNPMSYSAMMKIWTTEFGK